MRNLRPDFVGMKLWNGDGFTGSVIIAERLRREFPSLPIYGAARTRRGGAEYTGTEAPPASRTGR